MKRELLFVNKDGTKKVIEIGQAIKLNIDKPMFELQRLKDGRFKLLWSRGFLDEFSDVDRIEIVRED